MQTAVALAVVFSDIHFGWANGASGLAVCVVALFAAWFVTALVIAVRDLASKLHQALLLRRNQSVDDGAFAGREVVEHRRRRLVSKVRPPRV
jgi:hypothetical protein